MKRNSQHSARGSASSDTGAWHKQASPDAAIARSSVCSHATGAPRRLTCQTTHTTAMTHERTCTQRHGSIAMCHMTTQAMAKWSGTRAMLCKITQSAYYDAFMMAIILGNVVIAVNSTDMRARQEKLSFFLVVSPFFFAAIYVVDVAVRVYVTQTQFPKDIMNVFDASVVSIDLVTLLFDNLLPDARFVSALRALRMLKVVRVLRRLRQFRELYLMIQGVAASVKPVCFGTLLLFFNLVLWSILSVELLHPRITEMMHEGALPDCNHHCALGYASVADALLTLTATSITGDGWSKLAVPLMRRHTWTCAILVPSLLSVQLGLLNVIAAVLVDCQTQAREQDAHLYSQIKHEERMETFEKLGALFDSMDVDGSGALTEKEFRLAYHDNADFKRSMDKLDISQEDISMLFQIMDTNDSGEVSSEEFINELVVLETVSQRTLLVLANHVQQQLRNQIVGLAEKIEGIERYCETFSQHPDKAMKRSDAWHDLSNNGDQHTQSSRHLPRASASVSVSAFSQARVSSDPRSHQVIGAEKNAMQSHDAESNNIGAEHMRLQALLGSLSDSATNDKFGALSAQHDLQRQSSGSGNAATCVDVDTRHVQLDTLPETESPDLLGSRNLGRAMTIWQEEHMKPLKAEIMHASAPKRTKEQDLLRQL